MKRLRRNALGREPGSGANTPLDARRGAGNRPGVDASSRAPLARSLIDYWYMHRGPGGVPDRRSFDPFPLVRWLGYLSIYEYDAGRDDFRNRLEGTFVTELTGENWTRRYASEVDARFGSRFLPELRDVRRRRMPSTDFIRVYQKDFSVAVRVLLPVCSGVSVNTAADATANADQVFVAIFADRGEKAGA